MQLTNEVYNDPILLHTYLVERYGRTLMFGCESSTVYARALNLTKHLARLTGYDLQSLVEEISDDYAITEHFAREIEAQGFN